MSRTIKDTPRVKKTRGHGTQPKKARLMRNFSTQVCCGDITTRAMDKRVFVRDLTAQLLDN